MNDLVGRLKGFFPAPLHDRIYLVGGMVRDLLTGTRCQDIDLVAAISPSEITPLGFRLVESRSTPDIYFRFDRDLGKIEVTLIPSPDALRADLERRDFTINAMAMTLDGLLHDPLAGRRDLENRVLRTCSSTSLADDPVRIFRALRFECDGFRLDREAEAAISAGSWTFAPERTPVERFSQEMLKALARIDPGRFFRRLLEFRAGEGFLPELFRMPAVPAGPLQHHPEGDLFSHCLEVLERMAALSPDPKARFCALFHDLGKLSTPKDQYPKHHGHDTLGGEAAEPFCRRLRLPTELQRALAATCRLHTTANRWQELRDSTRIKLALGAIKGGIADILPQVVAADGSGPMPGWERTLRVASLNASQLGIAPEIFQGADCTPETCQQIIMQRRVQALRKDRP